MIIPPNETTLERHLRRSEAAKYVVETYNVPCSPKTLAKLACVSSDGPMFRLAGRFPLYARADLDAWVLSRIGPAVRSTSAKNSVQGAHRQRHTAAKTSCCQVARKRRR